MGQEEKPLSVRGERTKQWSPLLGQTIWTHVSRRSVSRPSQIVGEGEQEHLEMVLRRLVWSCQLPEYVYITISRASCGKKAPHTQGHHASLWELCTVQRYFIKTL